MSSSHSLNTGGEAFATPSFTEQLRIASETLDQVHTDPAFLAYCDERGVSAHTIAEPAYWQALADFAYEEYGDEDADGNRISTNPLVELTLAATDFAVTKWSLHEVKAGTRVASLEAANAYGDARERVAHFTRLIHQAAEAHPELRVSALSQHLLNAAATNITNPRTRARAEWNIVGQALGVQAENGLNALFAANPDTTVEPGSISDDLGGTDFWVTLGVRQNDGSTKQLTVRVDAKGSMADIEQERIRARRTPDPENPCYMTLDRDGSPHVKMFALLTAKDYGDTFFPRPDVVAQRAPMAAALLLKAVRAEGYGYLIR